MQLNINHLSILTERVSAEKSRVRDLQKKVAFLGNGSMAPKFRKALKQAQKDLKLFEDAVADIKRRHGLN